jgi:hypothetical protein
MVANVVLWALFAVAWSSKNTAADLWDGPHVKWVRVEALHGGLSRSISDRVALDVLIACLRRAERLGAHREARRWTHRIDIQGDTEGQGRWLYDAAAGELTRLTKAVSPIYRLSAADKSKAEELMLPDSTVTDSK